MLLSAQEKSEAFMSEESSGFQKNLLFNSSALRNDFHTFDRRAALRYRGYTPTMATWHARKGDRCATKARAPTEPEVFQNAAMGVGKEDIPSASTLKAESKNGNLFMEKQKEKFGKSSRRSSQTSTAGHTSSHAKCPCPNGWRSGWRSIPLTKNGPR